MILMLFLFVPRLRYLLRQLNRGEISAETLQKNLQYAAKVLEAVYIDETKYVSSRKGWFTHRWWWE